MMHAFCSIAFFFCGKTELALVAQSTNCKAATLAECIAQPKVGNPARCWLYGGITFDWLVYWLLRRTAAVEAVKLASEAVQNLASTS